MASLWRIDQNSSFKFSPSLKNLDKRNDIINQDYDVNDENSLSWLMLLSLSTKFNVKSI